MSALLAVALRQWRSCREDFEVYREAAYAAAEEATSGALVNRRGQAKGISAWSLFIGSDIRARAYASPELIEWWDAHPRLTFAAFEAQWMEPESGR